MLILAVDTTTPAGSLAVVRAEGAHTRLLGSVSSDSDEPYSSRLFRQLEFLLREVRLATRDFDLFAVSAGPGSFTGLRVGLTAVKGWAEVHGRPIAPVSALEAVACMERTAAPVVVPVMDAHRGQVFANICERRDGRLKRQGDDALMNVEEFIAIVKEAGPGAALVSPDAEAVSRLLSSMPVAATAVESVSRMLAPAIAELGWKQALRGEVTDALNLDANYVRRSDAEMMWKDAR
jgi:tRNA threonylcarbamoyladenosine biosynthesis protein TsaB